jgi:tryptophan synthase alpha chain
MAGDPNLNTTYNLVLELEKSGVDIIELGMPFSDPTADGAVIQEADIRSLKKNTNLKDILKLVKFLRKKTQIPIVLMTYYNPVFHFGQKIFVNQAKSSGIDGLLVVDLIPEEAGDLIKEARRANLDTIFFISPTTTKKRIELVRKLSRGFVYYVSLTGVTGPRDTLPSDIVRYLRSLKRSIRRPVCVGFGISNPNQVKNISRSCDGIIVGSAIVKKIKENIGRKDLAKRVGTFTRGLANPL